MAKVVFRFFEVNVEDNDALRFVKKIEEVLKDFAGEAYHFRYYIEELPNAARHSNEWIERP